jgi:hypothetical protein
VAKHGYKFPVKKKEVGAGTKMDMGPIAKHKHKGPTGPKAGSHQGAQVSGHINPWYMREDAVGHHKGPKDHGHPKLKG